jgi:hypothetical protein
LSAFSWVYQVLRRPLLPLLRRPATLRKRLRLVISALALAIAFSASTFSSPGDGLDLLRSSLKSGADRLVELQSPEGAWPHRLGGFPELSTSGRPARALLAAHAVLGQRSHLAAAERTAETLLLQVGRNPRAASPANLLFLAEFGRDQGRSDCLDAAREAFGRYHEALGRPPGAVAAAAALNRPNPTDWSDGAWRNYLLWSSGEIAELAHAVGEPIWAAEYSVGLAESWVPKHDHSWYAMGAGRTLAALARVPGPNAKRLAAVETALLRNNETIPGIAWNETPYDAFAYTMETAAALQGLLVASDVEARLAGQEGLLWLARQQSTNGGWGSTFSLFEDGVRVGSQDWVPDAELAVDETPELDAEVVLALSIGLKSAPLKARQQS